MLLACLIIKITPECNPVTYNLLLISQIALLICGCSVSFRNPNTQFCGPITFQKET